MSRRQRKNVKKRGKDSENLSTTTNNLSNCSGGTGNGNPQDCTKNQKKRSSQPSKFHVSLGLNDDQIYYHLLNYILDQDTLRSIGSYPSQFVYKIYIVCGRYNVFKKKLNSSFDPENMKKPPSKVAHNWPKIIFFSTGLAAQMARKQKSHTIKSPLMQNWVFRLGLVQIK